MRNVMLVSATVFLLLSEAWSLVPVTTNLTFSLGSEVNLTCGDRTWNETLYVIWKVVHQGCQISHSRQDRGLDTCNSGTSLRNTSRAQSYLHIPKLSAADEGTYECNFVFYGDYKNCRINLAITTPPSLSAWIEQDKDKTVAVCRAEGGKPAANISWTPSGRSRSVETRVPGSRATVESRLVLDEAADTQNLSCAVSHPYWEQEQILKAKPREDHVRVLLILAGVVISVFLGGLAFFMQRKISTLRRCHRSDSSSSKSPPIEDVEEVEPYASYVQRVNSIYN